MAKKVKLPPEVESIASAMMPALQQHYYKLVRLLETVDFGALEARFSLGESILEIREGDENLYGSNAIAQLSSALGISVTEAYVSAAVYEQWTEEDRQMFLSRRMPNGRLITFSHLQELARIGQASRRRKLMEKVYTYGWSTRDLRLEIRKINAKDKPHQVDPVSYWKTVDRWLRASEKLRSELDAVRTLLDSSFDEFLKRRGFADLLLDLHEAWDRFGENFNFLGRHLHELVIEIRERRELAEHKEAEAVQGKGKDEEDGSDISSLFEETKSAKKNGSPERQPRRIKIRRHLVNA